MNRSKVIADTVVSLFQNQTRATDIRYSINGSETIFRLKLNEEIMPKYLDWVLGHHVIKIGKEEENLYETKIQGELMIFHII